MNVKKAFIGTIRALLEHLTHSQVAHRPKRHDWDTGIKIGIRLNIQSLLITCPNKDILAIKAFS